MNIERTMHFYQIKWIDEENDRITKDIELFKGMIKSVYTKKPVKNKDYYRVLEDNTNDLNDGWFFGKSSKLKTDDYPLVHDIEGNNTSGLNLEKNQKY